MTNKKLYENILTKDFFLKEYVENKKNCTQISKETGICLWCVIEYLKNHGIEKRPRGLDKGMRFGKLTLIEKNGIYKTGSYLWLCLCDCGKYTKVPTSLLKNGNTKSCGCLHKVTGKDHNGWKGFGEISGHKWYAIQKKSLDRNIDFNITIEQAWNQFEKQNGKCYLSGMDLCFNKFSKAYSDGIASLDRIDSSVGYEVNNIGWVHKDINSMKHEFSIKEFVHYCELISNFNGVFNKTNYNLNISTGIITSAKHRYKKRNLEFNITTKDVLKKFNDQGGVCALSGLKLTLPNSNAEFKKFEWTASLDRINNDLGYTFDNIQIVHKLINKSRKNLTIEKYKELCKNVYLYNMQ